MHIIRAATAVALLLGSVAPTLATPCKDEISTIERRLDSSGAAKAEGKKPSGETTPSNPSMALDKQPSGDPSDPGTKPTPGGVADAKAMVAKARAQEEAGDEKGCQETIIKVKETAGALP